MSLDGSGTYAPPPPFFPAVPNTTILANDFNQIILDMAAALSLAIYRDGQAPFTANQSHGGFKITSLANGVAAQDAVTFLQVFTDPTFNGTTVDGVQVTGSKFKVTAVAVELPANTSIGNVGAAEIAFLDGVTSPLQGQVDGKANLAGGNIFAGLQQLLASLADGSVAVTQPATDNSNLIATTHYVHDVAMNAALPTQDASTVGKVPVSDGTAAHWGGIAGNSLYLAINLGAL